MTVEEIIAGESVNVEYKVDIPSSNEKYMKTVIGFANGTGGRLVFGVEDTTWKIKGFSKEDIFTKMDQITNAIFDSCEPKITPSIGIQEIEGKAIIVVDILSGMEKPYYLKKYDVLEGTFIRVGGTTRHAERYEIQELIL